MQWYGCVRKHYTVVQNFRGTNIHCYVDQHVSFHRKTFAKQHQNIAHTTKLYIAVEDLGAYQQNKLNVHQGWLRCGFISQAIIQLLRILYKVNPPTMLSINMHGIAYVNVLLE